MRYGWVPSRKQDDLRERCRVKMDMEIHVMDMDTFVNDMEYPLIFIIDPLW